jgi:hypothetical protein
MKYEILITAKDELEIGRKKEGDIIDVIPYPHIWGKKELNKYLVVTVENNLTLEQMWKLAERFIGVKKYSYSMPLVQIKKYLPELDLDKVRNESIAYQPFKKFSEISSIIESGVDCGVEAEKEKTINCELDLIKDNNTSQFIDVTKVL